MRQFRLISKSLVVAILGLTLTSCATPSPRAERVPNSFAWFDLVTDQSYVARDYYKSLFGWRFGSAAEDGYQVISSGGELIGGLSPIEGAAPDVSESQWVAVLSVDDIMATSELVKRSGGKVIAGPLQTNGGNFTLVRDNSGAALTLYDGTQGFPVGQPAKVNTWVWVDLFTDRPNGAKSFYSSLAGFETMSARDRDGNSYTNFTSDGQPRGGLVRSKASEIEPNWLPFVLVSDLDTTLTKASKLGGSVLAREGGSAIVVDPTGAAIGVTVRKGNVE